MVMLGLAKNNLLEVNYCGYKELLAMFVLKANNGEVALVDSGTPAYFPAILNDLAKSSILPNQISSIFVTHSHLDHSGNLSLWTRYFPHIRIYAHPLAIERLANPSDLCNRMARSMGERFYPEFYDEVRPVPEKFFYPISDGEVFNIGGSRPLECIFTPGHADDHMSIIDHETSTIFTGDAFGLRYSMIDPTTSIFSFAPGFNLEGVYYTLNRIKERKELKRAGVAHFGWISDVVQHADSCLKFADDLIDLVQKSANFKKDLIEYYEGMFGKGFMTTWHRIKGTLLVNMRGLMLWNQAQSLNVCM
jgi:glyoxylase-like metal-dependent hydrolase (beta-lactamase superfamily II)